MFCPITRNVIARAIARSNPEKQRNRLLRSSTPRNDALFSFQLFPFDFQTLRLSTEF
jgi:hypothetical protein